MPELSPTADASTITARTLEQHRRTLTGHCYRMLGSAAEADDAVQETMVRAWRNLHGFEGRSSLRTWLIRISTRVCLDALEARGRRMLVRERGPAGGVDSTVSSLDTQPGSCWLEPIADAEALPADADPDELLSLRQSIRLAFVAALQHLPPRQRAMLLLTDVLGWSAAEAASCLEVSVAAVNSALQRARATLSTRDLAEARAPLSPPQLRLVDRYVEAFERYDMDALTALLHADATMAMPPHALWFRGHDAIRAWLTGPGAACRGSRLVPTRACDAPAFGHYKPGPDGGLVPWSLILLEFSGEHIAAMTYFLDTEALFPRFGLPPALP